MVDFLPSVHVVLGSILTIRKHLGKSLSAHGFGESIVTGLFLSTVAAVWRHIGRARTECSGWNRGSAITNPQDGPPRTLLLHIGPNSSKFHNKIQSVRGKKVPTRDQVFKYKYLKGKFHTQTVKSSIPGYFTKIWGEKKIRSSFPLSMGLFQAVLNVSSSGLTHF